MQNPTGAEIVFGKAQGNTVYSSEVPCTDCYKKTITLTNLDVHYIASYTTAQLGSKFTIIKHRQSFNIVTNDSAIASTIGGYAGALSYSIT